MIISVNFNDLDNVYRIENDCFPSSEAAPKNVILKRIETLPSDFFLVSTVNDEVVGFVNATTTNNKFITDDLYEEHYSHKVMGKYLAIMSLAVSDKFQHQGIAASLMNSVLKNAMSNGLEGAVLTCKKELIHYYERFGFENKGVSESCHGGSTWYDMVFIFNK